MSGWFYLSLLSALGIWAFGLGMSKWTARRTSYEEPWWLLAWGNLMRIGALFSILATVYFMGKALGL